MASPGAAVAPTPTVFDNSSAWHNFTSWTVQHLRHSVNVTRYAPSLEDLILAGPRMLTKLGSFIAIPDAVDGFGQRVIPDPTGSADYFLTTTASEMAAEVSDAAATVANVANVLENDQDPAALVSKFSLEGAKGLGSVFSYATSRWAFCCIAMAIILNRTHIFAASRRRLRLTWPVRLLLRFGPIILFTIQARQLLQSIQCQTSPDFAELRWGNASKTSDLMFAQPSAYLHGLSSTLLLGASDYDSCRAINMIPPGNYDFTNELRGSLSRLWPLFGTLCLSHFLETISCAVQGRPVAVETGMTLFEHSLAFAEADAAISNQLGWGLFSTGSSKSNITFQQASGASIAISRSMIMNRVNTPPEVLLVAFLSSMSHITSHVLGVFGLQNKYRLMSTGFWAMCFMGSLVAEATSVSLDDPSSMGLFRFPTVCIIGFIPHVMVFAGIFVCFVIYAIALVLSALQPPERWNNNNNNGAATADANGNGNPGAMPAPPSFRERLARAHENMQANISLSDIRIAREMDFYTALLRTGFGVITMASEAVYLNEDRRVGLKRRTWLEEDRLRELEATTVLHDPDHPHRPHHDHHHEFYNDTIGLVPVVPDAQLAGRGTVANGYARERAAQTIPKARVGDHGHHQHRNRARDGVGAAERTSRWLLALDFLMNINRLLLRWSALLLLKALARVGVRARPRLLLWLSRWPKDDDKSGELAGEGSGSNNINNNRAAGGRGGRYYGAGGIGGRFFNDELVDVEAEVRRRLRAAPETAHLPDREIDARLYASWKHGDLWGSVDDSGDWEPDTDAGDEEWDTTSLAYSTIGDDSDNESDTHSSYPYSHSRQGSEDPWVSDDDDNYDRQRTPTQRSPSRGMSREPTPGLTPATDQPIDMADLARLLHPRSPSERRDAHALAAHLASGSRIVTRARYARMQAARRGRVLLRQRRGFWGQGGQEQGQELVDEVDEEAELLESLILARRGEVAAAAGARGAGMGGAGVGGNSGVNWAGEAGNRGMGGVGGVDEEGGPQCVVCHSAPRKIIVWPCRCLSLCDECRVTLAMNNFDKCVCCRREVVSFSRIYVP
ncbi:hypothetical protein F5B20DRAFT_430666 [Whalleya microplaca]|nr:hypothetical protein F5B20DRAFT_430666 [Whalleya microplaca]